MLLPAIGGHAVKWENPPMKIARAGTTKRVVLPGAEPGDVFDVQREGEERYVLVRLRRPPPRAKPAMNREECLEAITAFFARSISSKRDVSKF